MPLLSFPEERAPVMDLWGGRLTVLLGVCEWIITIHLADEGLVLEVRATC